MAKTVKIRALRPFFGTYGKVAKDQVVEVSEAHARKYEQRGIAVAADFKGTKSEATVQNKEATSSAPLSDKEAGQTGGPAGAKQQPWSSSEAAPAPDKSTSTKSKK